MTKKALILVGLAITPAAALAAPSPTSVSIAADPMVVIYGSPTKLSGMVSPAKSLKVEVTAQACVKGRSPLSVTSTAQGAWSTSVRPASNTVFQAKAKSAVSPELTVQVRPLVALAKVGSHRFSTQISAAQSFAGKIALFQKRTSIGWRTLKSVVLVARSSSNGTVVSGKTFRSGVHTHRTVRVLLTRRQVGPCYAAGTSNSIPS